MSDPNRIPSRLEQRVRALVAPLVDGIGCSLYDLEVGSGLVRVTVSRPGGADLETIEVLTRLISRELDAEDPLPGRYTLEVSTPGLERPLRRPEHYRGAIGATVKVKVHAGAEVAGERRLDGVLVAADDEGPGTAPDAVPDTPTGAVPGVTLLVVGADGPVHHRIAYRDIESARTVFVWAAQPKPVGPRAGSRTPSGPSARPAPVPRTRTAGSARPTTKRASS